MGRTWMAMVATAALVAGCAVSDYGRESEIPVGSELVLHERLTLEPGNARVYIQDGEVVAPSDIDRYRTACYLRVQRRGDEPLVDAIHPARFLAIEGPQSWTEPARFGRDRDFPRTPQQWEYHTQLEIRSDRHPQVDELHCRYHGWRNREAPGPGRIQATLGNPATVESPAAAPGSRAGRIPRMLSIYRTGMMDTQKGRAPAGALPSHSAGP